MRVLITGWVGSTNLGDELVLAGLRRLSTSLGASILVLSRSPAATRSVHGTAAVPGGLVGTALAAGRVGAGILGGGGLIQDETSPLNLPYHLARVGALAARQRPWAGVGLGVGPLHTRLGRRLAGALRGAVGVSVRDAASARLLGRVGVGGVEVAADTAFHLPAPAVAVEDVAVVSLRPWTGSGGHLLPVAWRSDVDATPEWFLDAAARQLDALAHARGLGVRFVALQTDRDHRLHQRVAARMATPAELRVPTLDTVVGEVARGRVVVAMRYHAAIAAILGGRPAVAIGYSPKVDALTAELGVAGRCLAWSPSDLEGLAAAVADVEGHREAVIAARQRLVARADGNRRVLERLLAAAR